MKRCCFCGPLPPSPKVLRQTEALLSAFHQRVAALRAAGADLSPLDPMEVSGIAGTAIEDSLNYDVSRWLLRRFPGRVDVAWDGYDKQTRLGETLPRFLPLLDDDAYVEADVPYLRWLRSARGGAGRDLGWLVSRFERLPRSERERAELFDSLELTVRWDLDNLRASRTRNWRSVRRVFYHPRPFIRRGEVDLVKEMRAPLRVARLARRDGEQALDLMRDHDRAPPGSSGVRRTAIPLPFSGPTWLGLEIYLWGLPPARRLPLRAYVAGFSLKNGVPINYIEAIGLFEWLEVSFNIFYAFRDGESAWLYARLLRWPAVTGPPSIPSTRTRSGSATRRRSPRAPSGSTGSSASAPAGPELLRIAEREGRRLPRRPDTGCRRAPCGGWRPATCVSSCPGPSRASGTGSGFGTSGSRSSD